MRAAAGELQQAAAALNRRRDEALARADRAALAALNDQLLRFERALLQDGGIPGRPWYRHLIYAPKFTYAPEVLPGLAEALDQGDASAFSDQAGQLATALRRAARLLSGARATRHVDK